MAKKAKKAAKKKHTLNPTVGKTSKPPKVVGAPFSEQDPKRRLGHYQTAGEHARQINMRGG